MKYIFVLKHYVASIYLVLLSPFQPVQNAEKCEIHKGIEITTVYAEKEVHQKKTCKAERQKRLHFHLLQFFFRMPFQKFCS